MKRFGKIVLLGLICAAGGCTTYYKVHDPTTGKDYYTTQIEEDRGGASTFKDARTGREVTVQNSEKEKITEEEFNTGRYAQPAPQSQPPMQMDSNKKTDASGNPF